MYTYEALKDDVNYLAFNGIVTGSIGRSVMGNEIYYIHTGNLSGEQIIITGGIHARENVTASLVIRQAYHSIDLHEVGIYFLPMLNPDGELIIEKNGDAGRYASLIKSANKSEDFSLWKANARAVDLNVNFDAKFGQGRGNVNYPAPHGYVGPHPFSEPETAALRDFTLAVKPIFTVSYHALGREIYWQFGQTGKRAERDRAMADKIGEYLGYKVVDGEMCSTGGYKDWCVLSGISAVTIEVGLGSLAHPVSVEDVEEDIGLNLDLPKKLPEFYRLVFGAKKQ